MIKFISLSIMFFISSCFFYREYAWMATLNTDKGDFGLNADIYGYTMPYLSINFLPNKNRKCYEIIIDSLSGFVIFYPKNSQPLTLPLSVNNNNRYFKNAYNGEPSSDNLCCCEDKITPFDLKIKISNKLIDSVNYNINAILLYKNESKIYLNSTGKLQKYIKP